MGLVEVLFNVALGKGGRKLSRGAGFREVTGKLKECSGSARPGFAFFFGDAFDVDDVGACLRQHVV